MGDARPPDSSVLPPDPPAMGAMLNEIDRPSVTVSLPSGAQQPPVPCGDPFGAGQHAFSRQIELSQGWIPPSTTYNMADMAAALPQAQYQPGQTYPFQPQFGVGSMQPVMAVSMPPQYPYDGSQPCMHPAANQQYYVSLPPHMPPYYGPAVQANSPLPPRPDVAYYPAQLVEPLRQQPQLAAQLMGQPTQSGHPIQPSQPHSGLAVNALPAATAIDRELSHNSAATAYHEIMPQMAGLQPRPREAAWSKPKPSAPINRKTVARGPPRKPKQSGHAIWIGNLPPQTDLMLLVHHVCRETEGLESLFLISKSNCAFANYPDETTCSAAQQRLHNSMFQAIPLVSRLRKCAVEGAPVLASDATMSHQASAVQTPGEKTTGSASGDVGGPGEASSDSAAGPAPGPAPGPKQPQGDRYFILKSLTTEDLELSVRTSIWATQAHNEEVLSAAYHSAVNVYLIFSANKSGEYFGYARMVSSIDEDVGETVQFSPTAPVSDGVDPPKAIPVAASGVVPSGRIIDDSSRGTIFWEAVRGSESAEEVVEETSIAGVAAGNGSKPAEAPADQCGNAAGQSSGAQTAVLGKPFRLEWLSTSRLPFYRTRGLRNSLNSNREVKIARDGTELDPMAGRRLVLLFHKSPPSHSDGRHEGSRARQGASSGASSVLFTPIGQISPSSPSYQ